MRKNTTFWYHIFTNLQYLFHQQYCALQRYSDLRAEIDILKYANL